MHVRASFTNSLSISIPFERKNPGRRRWEFKISQTNSNHWIKQNLEDPTPQFWTQWTIEINIAWIWWNTIAKSRYDVRILCSFSINKIPNPKSQTLSEKKFNQIKMGKLYLLGPKMLVYRIRVTAVRGMNHGAHRNLCRRGLLILLLLLPFQCAFGFVGT